MNNNSGRNRIGRWAVDGESDEFGREILVAHCQGGTAVQQQCLNRWLPSLSRLYLTHSPLPPPQTSHHRHWENNSKCHPFIINWWCWSFLPLFREQKHSTWKISNNLLSSIGVEGSRWHTGTLLHQHYRLPQRLMKENKKTKNNKKKIGWKNLKVKPIISPSKAGMRWYSIVVCCHCGGNQMTYNLSRCFSLIFLLWIFICASHHFMSYRRLKFKFFTYTLPTVKTVESKVWHVNQGTTHSWAWIKYVQRRDDDVVNKNKCDTCRFFTFLFSIYLKAATLEFLCVNFWMRKTYGFGWIDSTLFFTRKMMWQTRCSWSKWAHSVDVFHSVFQDFGWQFFYDFLLLVYPHFCTSYHLVFLSCSYLSISYLLL